MRMATTLTLLALVTGASACQREAVEDTFGQTLAVAGHVSLDVTNLDGATCIGRGADGRVVLLGRVHAEAFDRAEAQRVLRRVLDHPPVTVEGGCVVLGRQALEGDVRIDWKLQVPRDTEVRATVEAGHTCAADVDGPVTIDGVSGGVEVHGIAKAVRLHTVSGDVQVADVAGADVGTVSGSATIDRVPGDVRVQTVSGGVLLGEVGRIVHASTTSGDVDLDSAVAGDALWDLTTTSGGVTLQVPADAAARFELRTVSGRLDALDGATASLAGADDAVELGRDPKALVSVHTTSGDLHLRRRP